MLESPVVIILHRRPCLPGLHGTTGEKLNYARRTAKRGVCCVQEEAEMESADVALLVQEHDYDSRPPRVSVTCCYPKMIVAYSSSYANSGAC